MEAGPRIKLPSNDSFEEDAMSDVDDEVFIKSARNGFRNGGGKDKTLQKPLMAPRKKSEREKKSGLQNGHRSNGTHLMDIHTSSPHGSPVLITVLYVTIALGAITGLTGLVIFLAKAHLPTLVSQVGLWRSGSKDKGGSFPEPCNSLAEEAIWDVNLPHAISYGQKVMTTADFNLDGVDDVVIGFDSGLNGVTPLTSFLCQLYFNTTSTVCDGGLIGLNGSTGAILWTTWLDDAVASVQCLADLDLDGVKDCVAIGQSRGLWAVSSGDGKLIWGLATDGLQLPCLADSAFRSAQTVEDVNGDKVPDLVVAIKGGRGKCPDYVALISGLLGNVLQLTGTADGRPLSLGPMLQASGDGSTLILYATTGSSSNASSLYLASLKDVATGRKDLVRLVLGNVSRIESLATSDITGDGMEDLILVMDNNTAGGGGKDVMAMSGPGFERLWTSRVPSAARLKIQALANLNEDGVPDVVLQMTGRPAGNNTNGSNATWIRVLDGKDGRVLMNLPPRSKRWDVRGGSLAVEPGGSGADVMIDWIADEDEADNNRAVNRLMGFSSRGELPAFVLYTTPTATPSRPSSGGPETSLHDVLDVVASQDDLRAKFSNYMRHAESERSDDPLPAAAAAPAMEIEPDLVGYPAQHGVRKHGSRWNSNQGRHGEPSYERPAYDYAEDEPSSSARRRKTPRPPGIVWGVQGRPAADVPGILPEDEDSLYLNPADYGADNTGSRSSGSSDYDREDPSPRELSRYQRPSKQSSWGNRRGKRIRRQAAAVDQPSESIRFPPLVVDSTLTDGSVDLLFGVQWSWSEPEEKEEQLRGLADCVTRRLDQGRMVSDDALVDYAAECSQALLLRRSSSSSESSAPSSAAGRLVSSAVDHWLRPLARRQHGWVSLKRLRLRCRCNASPSSPVTTTSSNGLLRPRPCSTLRPQPRKVDFSY